MLFISDTIIELDAATQTGIQVLFSQRPGNPRQRESLYMHIETFDELAA